MYMYYRMKECLNKLNAENFKPTEILGDPTKKITEIPAQPPDLVVSSSNHFHRVYVMWWCRLCCGESFLVSCLFHHKPDDVQSSATYQFKYICHCPFRCDKTEVLDFYNAISWFRKCHWNFPHYCVYTDTYFFV